MTTHWTMDIAYKNSNVGISYISGQLNEEPKIRIADNRSLPPVLSVFPFPSLPLPFPFLSLLFSFPFSHFFPSPFPLFSFLFPFFPFLFPFFSLPLSSFCRQTKNLLTRPNYWGGGVSHPPHPPLATALPPSALFSTTLKT